MLPAMVGRRHCCFLLAGSQRCALPYTLSFISPLLSRGRAPPQTG
jgi:hypothetical protein